MSLFSIRKRSAVICLVLLLSTSKDKASKTLMYVLITYGKKSTLKLVFKPMTLAQKRFESNVNKNIRFASEQKFNKHCKLVVYR